MAEELSPAVIKSTQDLLGKYVKKPSLTEKLLKKPPFRFLFDILCVVIRDKKCFVGLYTPDELAYENIKDRDDKMKFLQKIIDVVKLTTGSSLAIKTSKIVAGHEPEKTNELLQLMGEIIENNLDWQKAVEEVVSGKSTRKKSPRKPNEPSKKMSKDNELKLKLKEKAKDKDSKPKEAKISRTAGSKAAVINKDDKMKKSKIKEKEKEKESSSKRSKEHDKPAKKPVIDASNKKIQKLKKVDSQPNNRDSLNSQDVKQVQQQESKSMQNETECNHEESEQLKEISKVISSPTKLLQTKLSNSNETSVVNQNDSLQMKSLSAEKSSAKSRKSSAEKMVENSGENDEDSVTKKNLKAKEKMQILETTNMNISKQDSLAANLDPQQNKELGKSHTTNILKQNETPASIEKSIQKPIQSPPASSSKKEIKRESTFTRENSVDSNKSNRPRTSLRPPSARPPSARPGAPRRRDKNVEIILQPHDQIKMSGIQVKLETFGDLDDDGEDLVIIENPSDNDVGKHQETNFTESEKIMQDEGLEQGHLVQQILKTQKELVQTDTSNQSKSDKDFTHNSVMRQTSARHMDNLRDVIQNITKSVNPLGKLMDFIPEDIDAMQLEFTMWRDTYTQATNELKREKSLTESATEPMKNQLVQIEANIAEYVEMIDAIRAKNLQNYDKIVKMLTT